MTAETYHHPTRQELLAPMIGRLVRVQAAADTVRSLADMRSTSNDLLADALHALEHDLQLAAREAGNAADRVAS
jgi:hypothetical protein